MSHLPLMRSFKGTALILGLFALMFGLSFTPFALWVGMFLYGLGITAIITVTLSSGLYAGIGALLFSEASVYVMFNRLGALTGNHQLGVHAAALALVYFLPPAVLYFVQYLKKTPFWKTVLSMIVCVFACQLVIFGVMQYASNGDLVMQVSSFLTDALENSPMGDTLLVAFNRSGMIALSDEMQNAEVGVNEFGMYLLPDDVRRDMLLSLGLLFRKLFAAAVPTLLVSMSIESGVLASAWPIRRAKKQQQKYAVKDVPAEQNPEVFDLEMPDLHTWHLPRGWGLRIGILGVGYFLTFAGNETLSMLGRLFYSVFGSVYSIQGIATLNYVQMKRGTSKPWRIGLPIFFMMALPNTMMFLGVMDQLTNMRLLRPLPEGAQIPPEYRDFPFRREEEENPDDNDNDNDDNELI